jgi:cobalt/nickel transport system ATP-binding protein
MTEPALEFREVSVRHEPDGPAVLAEVSFLLGPGERAALIGLNGSGKTSLLLASVGLAAHEGEIRVGGVSLSSATLSAVREQVGFLFNVPEDQLLFPRVIDDTLFGLLRRGVDTATAREKARQTLAALGMEAFAGAPLHHLSHGQKQRVALAGALVTEPRLLLLDEPSAGLDPPARKELAAHLRGLGSAMLVATHDLDFAERFCTRFILLERGHMQSDGTDVGSIRQRWA